MGTVEKEVNEGKREDLWGLARSKEETTKLHWPSVGADGSCRAAVGHLGWWQLAFSSAFLRNQWLLLVESVMSKDDQEMVVALLITGNLPISSGVL
ncbi:unnamed protein product [Lactuca saligna]|uniref:Uncharacterized protein n=1 Tax=Lactuca saligna TaxID=75948 RepID=A0AA35YCL6_LACSI|nr:unnamed protein product [Lactuca saligna]